MSLKPCSPGKEEATPEKLNQVMNKMQGLENKRMDLKAKFHEAKR